MICPACQKTLVSVTAGAVDLDICQEGCQGIWFDNFELKKFDERHEELGDVLELHLQAPLTINTEKRPCPRCKSIIMQKRFTSVKQRVEIDQCGQCGGVWLDAGELMEMRTEFATEEERSQAAQATFEEMFDAPLNNALGGDAVTRTRFMNIIQSLFSRF